MFGWQAGERLVHLVTQAAPGVEDQQDRRPGTGQLRDPATHGGTPRLTALLGPQLDNLGLNFPQLPQHSGHRQGQHSQALRASGPERQIAWGW